MRLSFQQNGEARGERIEWSPLSLSLTCPFHPPFFKKELAYSDSESEDEQKKKMTTSGGGDSAATTSTTAAAAAAATAPAPAAAEPPKKKKLPGAASVLAAAPSTHIVKKADDFEITGFRVNKGCFYFIHAC